MPTYRDIDGSLYYFDTPPEASTVRSTLVLVPPEEATATIEQPVPEAVSPWQIRKALNQLSLRDSVEAVVAQQPIDVRDGWEFATEFRRDNDILNSMAPALGIDLDVVFRLAVTM